MGLDEDFNKFATQFLASDVDPVIPRKSLTEQVVTSRTIGFPPSRFSQPVTRKEEEPYDDFPVPPKTRCCLFPWPDPDGESGGPHYPTTDLPATVVVNGTVTHTHVVGTYYFEATFGGVFYRIRPGVAADGVGRDGFWLQEATPGGVAGAGFCLIDPTVIGGIADEFNDHYDADGDTLTRVTPCKWTGAKTGGGTWILDYGITTPYKWHLTSTGGSPTSDDKDDPQDNPAGTYGGVTIVP